MQITLRTSIENLKIGETSSQLSCQSFIEFGYFGVHFSVTFSSASSVVDSFQICGECFPVFARDIFECVAYHMRDAALLLRLRECCRYGLLNARESV